MPPMSEADGGNGCLRCRSMPSPVARVLEAAPPQKRRPPGRLLPVPPAEVRSLFGAVTWLTRENARQVRGVQAHLCALVARHFCLRLPGRDAGGAGVCCS